MIKNAREYLREKFRLANDCLKRDVEYNEKRKKFPIDCTSNEDYFSLLSEREDALQEIWSPLIEFQKKYPKEPNYYIKKDSFYSRVFFTPGLEDVHYIITDDKIPARFIRNQLKNDSWSIVIDQDFLYRYTLLHLTCFLSIMRIEKLGEPNQGIDPYNNFKFPDYIPQCIHCGRHFVKRSPNQRYCDTCRETVKKMGFNPMYDEDAHRYCLNCGKHLPNDKHKKAKFCSGACRTAYHRKKRKEECTENSNMNKDKAL